MLISEQEIIVRRKNGVICFINLSRETPAEK